MVAVLAYTVWLNDASVCGLATPIVFHREQLLYRGHWHTGAVLFALLPATGRALFYCDWHCFTSFRVDCCLRASGAGSLGGQSRFQGKKEGTNSCELVPSLSDAR